MDNVQKHNVCVSYTSELQNLKLCLAFSMTTLLILSLVAAINDNIKMDLREIRWD
jgi:hypothetical protein